MRALAVAGTLAAGIFLGLSIGGCGSGAAGGPLVLAWHFADGRDCVNSGATRVELRLAPATPADQAAATYDCAAGQAPATVTTDSVPGEGTLYLDARSPYDGDLYRGQLSLDALFGAQTTTTATASADVTLYAAAAN